MLKIFSWNVNGLRAVIREGAFDKFISEYQPDILCLQEIKAKPEQVEFDFPGYEVFWNPAERAGYSGTAILLKRESSFSFSSLDLSQKNVIHWSSGRTVPSGRTSRGRQEYTFFFDKSKTLCSENEKEDSLQTNIAVSEGRVQVLEFSDFFLVNVYTPNSKPDLSRLELRHKSWDPEFLDLLKSLEMKKPVITCGDFNAAHQNIDLARPDYNHHNAGFTDEERKGISNIIDAGFIDSFRFLHPNSERYTWWSHWGNARANNVGWRIDYFFISSTLRKKLVGAEIYESVFGSDHCPIAIELNLKEE